MICVLATHLSRTDLQTRQPFKYGIATMTHLPHVFLRATCAIDGRSQDGIAADHLPPKWFTKDPARNPEDEIGDMLRVIHHAMAAAEGLTATSVFAFRHELYHLQSAWGAAENLPPLLVHFGTSLVERAVLDAFAHHRATPLHRLVQAGALGIDLGSLYPELTGSQTENWLPKAPLPLIVVRHTVGFADPLTAADIAPDARLDDGLPQSLEECIRTYRLRHFKINGQSDQDINRLEQVASLLARHAPADYAFSLDGNESFRSAEAFREFWTTLNARPALKELVRHLLFIEQLLHRESALDGSVGAWRRDWPGCPSIIIDESDADLGSLRRALDLGYAGTSHKNCKGVFKGFANACRIAQLRREQPDAGFLMSGEDLSNIGHVALPQDLAVQALLGITSVERNGHHYFAGLSFWPASWQTAVLVHHPDLYTAGTTGWPRLAVSGSGLRLGSVNAAPFGTGLLLQETETGIPAAHPVVPPSLPPARALSCQYHSSLPPHLKIWTRKEFLKTSLLTGGAALLARNRVSAAVAPVGNPNSDIRVGVIGLNLKGAAHIRHLVNLPGVRLAALCDVDPVVLAREVEALKTNNISVFATTDARALMDRVDLDAVVIASSDQWHALHTIWALQAGKDVYVEKPVCRTIWEGRQILAAAAKFGRIVQTGTQSRSDPGIAEGVAAVQSGRLGKIQWIHALCYRLRESIGRRQPWYPDWLDYDRFCGPTPMVPLVRGQLHYDWHWKWGTGGGDLSNIGVHQIDIARWFAGNPPLPRRAMSFGGRFVVDDAAETPNIQLAVYDFPEFPVFFETRGTPARPGTRIMDTIRGIREGTVVQCEHGYYAGYYGGGLYDNDGKRLTSIKGDGGGGHMANFLAAVRSRRAGDLAAPLAGGFNSSACCHFGNISYRVGRPAGLDEIGQVIGNYTVAQAQLARIQQHLAVHQVDIARTPLTLGPWLELDKHSAGITAVVDGADASTLDRARFFLKETQRPPYVIPETF